MNVGPDELFLFRRICHWVNTFLDESVFYQLHSAVQSTPATSGKLAASLTQWQIQSSVRGTLNVLRLPSTA